MLSLIVCVVRWTASPRQQLIPTEHGSPALTAWMIPGRWSARISGSNLATKAFVFNGCHHRQWVLEDEFCADRPQWEEAGAMFVQVIITYVLINLFTLARRGDLGDHPLLQLLASPSVRPQGPGGPTQEVWSLVLVLLRSYSKKFRI